MFSASERVLYGKRQLVEVICQLRFPTILSISAKEPAEFQDEKAQADTLKGLQSAEGYIRRELAHTLNMRNTPEIKFVLDQSIEYGVRMSKKIDDVTRDLREEDD